MANSLPKMAKNGQNAQKGPFLTLSSTFLLLKVRDNMVFMKNERAHAPFKFLSVSFWPEFLKLDIPQIRRCHFIKWGQGSKKGVPKNSHFWQFCEFLGSLTCSKTLKTVENRFSANFYARKPIKKIFVAIFCAEIRFFGPKMTIFWIFLGIFNEENLGDHI